MSSFVEEATQQASTRAPPSPKSLVWDTARTISHKSRLPGEMSPRTALSSVASDFTRLLAGRPGSKEGMELTEENKEMNTD